MVSDIKIEKMVQRIPMYFYQFPQMLIFFHIWNIFICIQFFYLFVAGMILMEII